MLSRIVCCDNRFATGIVLDKRTPVNENTVSGFNSELFNKSGPLEHNNFKNNRLLESEQNARYFLKSAWQNTNSKLKLCHIFANETSSVFTKKIDL